LRNNLLRLNLLVHANNEDKGDSVSEEVVIRGPHGWLNWYAERAGYPRREKSHPDSMVIHPIWEEFAVYSDVLLGGGWLTLGPYEFVSIDHVIGANIGHARKLVILRAWDHIPDEPPTEALEIETDVEDYVGGDIGVELSALLSLALGRRFSSGGRVRQGLPIETLPVGLADESQHRAPYLVPPHRRPLIDGLAATCSLQDAKPLMERYPTIDGADAVALVRSANQYADALWLADADPRLAWIKFIGALEAAANRRDDSRSETPINQLKRHKPKIYRQLEDDREALALVAEETSRLFRAEVKVRSFVKAFDPGPPSIRPESPAWHFEWDGLDDALKVIYNHRSRDLHDGIAFPWPLCEEPHLAEDDSPSERFPAIAVSGRGGRWEASELPMYLHVFAHLVGGCLRNWWHSMGRDPDT
jgi:hypothetical protein